MGTVFPAEKGKQFDAICATTATIAFYFAFNETIASWLEQQGVPASQGETTLHGRAPCQLRPVPLGEGSFCLNRSRALSANAVTIAVSRPKHRLSPRATLYSPPSETSKFLVVQMRRSPGSKRLHEAGLTDSLVTEWGLLDTASAENSPPCQQQHRGLQHRPVDSGAARVILAHPHWCITRKQPDARVVPKRGRKRKERSRSNTFRVFGQ